MVNERVVLWLACLQGFDPGAGGEAGEKVGAAWRGLGAGFLDRCQLAQSAQPGSSGLADRSNDFATSPAGTLQAAMGESTTKALTARHAGFVPRRGAPCV
jgi:hypothetical protein